LDALKAGSVMRTRRFCNVVAPQTPRGNTQDAGTDTRDGAAERRPDPDLPTHWRHPMTEHHDRETVVVERNGSSGLATILGILVIVALLAAVWWFTLGPGAGGSTNEGAGGDNQVVPSLEVPGGGGEEPTSS
jgi:hypothetical protein